MTLRRWRLASPEGNMGKVHWGPRVCITNAGPSVESLGMQVWRKQFSASARQRCRPLEGAQQHGGGLPVSPPPPPTHTG